MRIISLSSPLPYFSLFGCCYYYYTTSSAILLIVTDVSVILILFAPLDRVIPCASSLIELIPLSEDIVMPEESISMTLPSLFVMKIFSWPLESCNSILWPAFVFNIFTVGSELLAWASEGTSLPDGSPHQIPVQMGEERLPA